MLSFLIFIYLTLYYIRPAEWVPGIVGAPLIMVAGIISLLYLGFGIITNRFPNILRGNSEKMMFGFVFAIIMSHVSHFYIGGAINSINIFLPSITGFFLIICYIDSNKRFHFLLLLLIILSTYLAYEGWLQYTTGFSHGGLEPVYQESELVDEEIVMIPRIRWYGVFNDPNDLGLGLVLVIPFLLNMLLQRQYLVPMITLPLISLAIYYTNSRGTVLAGLVAIGSYFIIRYRSFYGALVGGMFALVLFLFGPSRMSSVSASEESAYGRIEAWYEAYQMFKSNPVFGVGQGMFTDYHTLTAHNSFVLVMAELGFVGLFFYTGLFYFPLRWLWINLFKKESSILPDDYICRISSAFASLLGIMSAMFFISRSYMLIPFMLLALTTAVSRMHVDAPALLEESKINHLKNIFYLTLFQLIAINVIVKITL